MDVYWLEQTEAEVPERIDWVSENEVKFIDGLRFAPRRTSWRLGRWTAKRAVAAYLNLPDSASVLARIELRPAPTGAPEVFFDDQLAAISISISHRNGKALCAVAPGSIELGCDLELIEPRSNAFVGDYFTSEEQALLGRQSAADRPWLVALLWSAKESALKALHAGLRADTRSVVVSPLVTSLDQREWKPLIARHAGEKVFHGWWQVADNFVRTIAAAPPPAQPIFLEVAARVFDSSLCDPGSGFLVRSR
jgi:4'-phosphopantetheinyl transferase